MKSIIAAAVVATSLSGCIGPNPRLGVVDVGSTPAAIVRQAWTVQVVDAPPAGATMLGPVEGTSCKNKVWDKAPTEAKALEQLQIKALSIGVTAVFGVTYEKGEFSMVTNCWSSIKASGTAFSS